MQTEIEVKFLNTDHDEVRNRLKELGAVLEQPMRLMKRVTIDTPGMKAKEAFLRVRDQGDKVTLTYKQFHELSATGARELEITVSDFETIVKILAEAGLVHGSYQETKRETWRLGDSEVVLDEWPWLKPYIEIESPSEEILQKVAGDLGFDWKDAVFGDVMSAYRAEYPHLTLQDTVGNVPEVKFGDPLPDLLKEGVK